MSNTENTATATDGKRKVADHFLIAADGSYTKEMEKAVGIEYKSIHRPNAPFKFVFEGATAGTALTMLALFGAKTKATNEASRVRNTDKGDVDEELSAIEDVFEQLNNGVWREKSEGGAGSRIDRTTVAEAMFDVLGDKLVGTVLDVAQRFVDGYTNAKGKTMTGEEYFKFVWSNDAIKAAYRTRKGQTGPAADDLV